MEMAKAIMVEVEVKPMARVIKKIRLVEVPQTVKKMTLIRNLARIK
jgi:hypothetical protein